MTDWHMPPAQRERIVDFCWRLDERRDFAPLLDAMTLPSLADSSRS